MVICIASLHGNEPAGTEALQMIMGEVGSGQRLRRGDIVALRGNLRAYQANMRFIDEDMNRVWQPDRVRRVLRSLRQTGGALAGAPRSAELLEQRGLVSALHEAASRARGDVYVFDLHTTSADSAPFAMAGDAPRARELCTKLPIPLVNGLDRHIDGSMTDYFNHLSWPSIVIEGGRHAAASSVGAIEDVVWTLLEALGMLEAENAPGRSNRSARLARRSAGLPREMEVQYRHSVSSGDHFQMGPGFENFDRIRAGQELGMDRTGLVAAPQSGRLFLPLYQRLGDDGFFIVE